MNSVAADGLIRTRRARRARERMEAEAATYSMAGYQAKCRECDFLGDVHPWTPEGMALALRDGLNHGHTVTREIDVPTRKGWVFGAGALDFAHTEKREVTLNAWSVIEVTA